jgi:hypothetical protein
MLKVLLFSVSMVKVLVLCYLDNSVDKYFIYYGSYELTYMNKRVHEYKGHMILYVS